MSVTIIQAKYDDLATLAARFSQQAETSNALHQRVTRGIEALEDGGWEGRGASAFFTESRGEILPAIQRLQQALNEARAVTLEVSSILRAAEEEAAALFKGDPHVVGLGGGIEGTVIRDQGYVGDSSSSSGGIKIVPAETFEQPTVLGLPIPPWERDAQELIEKAGNELFDLATNKFKSWVDDRLPSDQPGETEKVTFNISQSVTATIPGLPIPLSLQGDKQVTIARTDKGMYEVTIKAGTALGSDVDVASVGAGGSAEVTYRFNPTKGSDMAQMAITLGAFGVTSPFLNPSLAAAAASLPSADNIVSARGSATVLGELGVDVSALSGEVSGSNELGIGVKRNERNELEVERYLALQRKGEADINPDLFHITERGAAGRVELASVHNTTTGEDSVRVTVTTTTSKGNGLGFSEGNLDPNASLPSAKGVATESTTTVKEYTFDQPVDDVRALLADSRLSESELRSATHGKVTKTTGTGSKSEIEGSAKGYGIESKADVNSERERVEAQW